MGPNTPWPGAPSWIKARMQIDSTVPWVLSTLVTVGEARIDISVVQRSSATQM